MRKIIFPILFILFSLNVFAVNNIYTFDEKDNIIISTSVYKENFPIENATCNLTVFNPYPNESIINISILMNNKGKGIYSIDLTENLSYNDNIYPITLYCNDSDGHLGSDDRVGIKIGVKVYDYIIPGGILIAMACLFIFMSFKLTDTLKDLKLLFFYLGHVFMLSALFYGGAVTTTIPNGGGFLLIFNVLESIYIIFILLMLFIQFKDDIHNWVNKLAGTK